MSLVIKGELVINASNTELTFNDVTGDYSGSNTGGYGTPNKAKARAYKTLIRITKPDGTSIDFDLDGTTVPSSDFVPKNAVTRTMTLAQMDISEEEFPDGVYEVQYIVWMVVDYSLGATYTIQNVTVGSEVVSKITGVNSTFTSVETGFGDTTVLRAVFEDDGTYEDFSIAEITSGTSITLEQLSQNFGLETDGAAVTVTVYAGYKSTFAFLDREQFMNCFIPKIAGISQIGSKGCGDANCATFKADREIKKLTELHLGLYSVEAQLEYGMWAEANKNMKTLTKLCKACNCGC